MYKLSISESCECEARQAHKCVTFSVFGYNGANATYTYCKMPFNCEIKIPKSLHIDGRFSAIQFPAQSAPLLPCRQHADHFSNVWPWIVMPKLSRRYLSTSVYAPNLCLSLTNAQMSVWSAEETIDCKHLCLSWSWCDETSIIHYEEREKCQIDCQLERNASKRTAMFYIG